MTIRSSTGFNPPAYTASRPLDPRDEYGGVGDGASHPLSSLYGTLTAAQVKYPHATALSDEIDWAAIQGVVNASITNTSAVSTTRVPLRPVLVSKGDWVLNRPIQVTSVQDLDFGGQGSFTRFRLGGAGLTSMIELNGTASSTFHDFTFADTLTPASHTTTYGLYLKWDNTTANRSSTSNQFRNITMRNINFTSAGIKIGEQSSGNQVDNTSWHGVNVNGDSRWHDAGGSSGSAVCWWVGDGTFGNNLAHSFTSCEAVRCNYGLYVDASQAQWLGGSIATTHGADIYANTTGYLLVDGIRSEVSARLLVTGGPASFGAYVQLSNIKWTAVSANLASDKRLIDWKLGGSLVLTNVTVTNPGSDPLVIYTGGNTSNPITITSTGVSVIGRSMAQLYSVGSNVLNKVVSYINTNSSGTVTSIESNAGGAAVGSAGSLQYNSSGSLAGDAGLTFDSGGQVLSVPALVMTGPETRTTSTSAPSTPASGKMAVWAANLANYSALATMDAAGLQTVSQPWLAQRHIGAWLPAAGSNTAPGLFGRDAYNVYGSATGRSPATTNLFTRMHRMGYVSAGTAGSFAGHRLGANVISTGGSGLGGFRYVCRFGISDAAFVSSCQMFVGVGPSGSASSVDLTALTFSIGVGASAADTTMHFICAGTAGQTPVDLGANFPVNTTNVDAYELNLYAPTTGGVWWKVTRLNTGNTATGTVAADGTGATILTNTSLISPQQAWRSNNATATAVGLDIMGHYFEDLNGG